MECGAAVVARSGYVTVGADRASTRNGGPHVKQHHPKHSCNVIGELPNERQTWFPPSMHVMQLSKTVAAVQCAPGNGNVCSNTANPCSTGVRHARIASIACCGYVFCAGAGARHG